jgi:hypothetical protein
LAKLDRLRREKTEAKRVAQVMKAELPEDAWLLDRLTPGARAVGFTHLI